MTSSRQPRDTSNRGQPSKLILDAHGFDIAGNMGVDVWIDNNELDGRLQNIGR